jgi:glycerol kinase
VSRYILALDQGTTSSRAILFDQRGRIASVGQQEFPQIFPKPGEVEHDPEAIWSSQIESARAALKSAGATATDVAAIGITNQRETTLVWERATGKPIANAIVWQSRVSAPICDQLKRDGLEPMFRERTGLLLDPYFSGTKLKHLLDTVSGLRARGERGEVLFGTVDSFLIWRLSNGRAHVTDASNASRTLLYNIHTRDWDDELLRALGVPRAMLPRVVASSGKIVDADASHFGAAIPVAGVAGDQQAALFGQACFTPGEAKNTYGTGCFLLTNTGTKPVASKAGLLTTVAWQIGDETTYALEGAVFVAGAAVQWLRDGLGIITNSSEVEALALSVRDSGGVYFVPAFVGLGAPYWDPYARGTIVGLTRDTTKAHIARAAVEAMAYQTRDVLAAMQRDSGVPLTTLKVDGGAARNNHMLQFQSNILQIPVRRPVIFETTALGAAYLAGLGVAFWKDFAEVSGHWALDREFTPVMARAEAEQLYSSWQRAVECTRTWSKNADTRSAAK